MTTMTMPNSGSAAKVLIVLFLIAGLLLMAGLALNQHALTRHGADARAVKNCLDNKGPYQTWKSKTEPNTFFDICGFSNGQWGVRVYTRIDGVEEEQTAYIISSIVAMERLVIC